MLDRMHNAKVTCDELKNFYNRACVVVVLAGAMLRNVTDQIDSSGRDRGRICAEAIGTLPQASRCG